MRLSPESKVGLGRGKVEEEEAQSLGGEGGSQSEEQEEIVPQTYYPSAVFSLHSPFPPQGVLLRASYYMSGGGGRVEGKEAKGEG